MICLLCATHAHYHCNTCRIVASGRPMVLTTEGNPNNTACSMGGCGNAKRVGHDIGASWNNVQSLIDIASGLWPFAHNSTNPLYGGWWNDMDMMQVSQGEFACSADAPSLARCQAHFRYAIQSRMCVCPRSARGLA